MKIDKKSIPDFVFLIIWVLLVGVFWAGLGAGSDAMGFAMVSMYIVLPVTALIVGIVDGFVRESGGKWLFVLVAALFGILCQWLTFDLANTFVNGSIHMPKWEMGIPAGIAGGLGLLIGSFVRKGQANRH